ncbi:hypothetical protein [Trichothermofontia sp.]
MKDIDFGQQQIIVRDTKVKVKVIAPLPPRSHWVSPIAIRGGILFHGKHHPKVREADTIAAHWAHRVIADFVTALTQTVARSAPNGIC